MREIVLDTETTGLSPLDHRIVEIGCVELINKIPTGKIYHQYINPERPMDAEATAVSGLTNEFLKDYPTFAAIANDFYAFVKDATLVIHNAGFDIGFLNAEFRRLSLPLFNVQDAIDTVQISRKKFPGQPANLDAICKRFNINLSSRTKHGALIDAKLLAEVYIMLLDIRQGRIFKEIAEQVRPVKVERPFREPRIFEVSAKDLESHQQFLKNIKNPLWRSIG